MVANDSKNKDDNTDSEEDENEENKTNFSGLNFDTSKARKSKFLQKK